MEKIALITDSTSVIPENYCKQYNITVLPQILVWGEETFRDGIDIKPDQFYQRLQSSKVLPTTSQVTIAAFKEAFTNSLDHGYKILAILLSKKLSGTIDSAVQAKSLFPDDAPITIIDSGSIAMAMGYQVLTIARAIENGATLESVVQMLPSLQDRSGVFITPETLEFLHRGGRIGNANRFLGTALNIKPILAIEDGQVEPLERVRTRRKAFQRIIELVEQKAAGKPVRVASLHANLESQAVELLEQAKQKLNVIEDMISHVSPVIGTHVGPGTIAFSYMVEP